MLLHTPHPKRHAILTPGEVQQWPPIGKRHPNLRRHLEHLERRLCSLQRPGRMMDLEAVRPALVIDCVQAVPLREEIAVCSRPRLVNGAGRSVRGYKLRAMA